MRFFWSLIALLFAATAVVFVVGPSTAGDRSSGALQQHDVGREQARSETTDYPNGERAGGSNPGRQEGDASTALASQAPRSASTRRDTRDHGHQQRDEPQSAAEDESAAGSSGGDNPLGFMNSILGTGDGDGAKAVSADVRAKDEAARSASITQLSDGIEVDDRFTIRGKGSPSDPFVIPWELLLSAEERYVPEDGREIMPGRVEMLHESWVSITGYVMLPTVRDTVEEFVIMQNQWDGCCIGIPPTPYDSVEVTLTEPMDFGFSGRQYATVTGRMRVEPYLFGNGMLLGLYEIVDAEIEVTEW